MSRSSSKASERVAELIELGRDREAAELGVAQGRSIDDYRSQTRGGKMEVLEQLDQLGPLLAGVVGGIRSDQLDNPTPCQQFTVRGVLDHMIAGATAFTVAFGGVAPVKDETGDVLSGFGPALDGLALAIHAPGALDRTIDSPFGAVSGDSFARFVVLDGLVHGWDLATATDQRYEPSDALVAVVDTFARQVIDPLRDGDTFAEAAEQPSSATAIERLIAFTGRTP